MRPETYDEVEDVNRTTERILKRMTDPKEQEKRKIKKEEKESRENTIKRLAL